MDGQYRERWPRQHARELGSRLRHRFLTLRHRARRSMREPPRRDRLFSVGFDLAT